MLTNRSMPAAVVVPVLGYPDVLAAARWLCDVFGFSARVVIGDHRVQLDVPGGGAVVVARAPDDTARAHGVAAYATIMVRVPDVDAHHGRTVTAGAEVLGPPREFPYGERQYSVADPGGHLWTFSQSMRDVAPADWGGTTALP